MKNPGYNYELESNLMNYTEVAVKNKPGHIIKDYDVLERYFEENVGKATKGQIQTIINNIINGHLNSDKDIPADRKPAKNPKN